MTKVERLSISLYKQDLDVVQAVIQRVPGVRNTSAAIQHIIEDYASRHQVVVPVTTAVATGQEPAAATTK